MHSFINVLVECSVTMTVLILMYFAITPLLEKRYTAKLRYYTWLVIVIGLIIPFRPHFDTAILKVDMPVLQEAQQVMPNIKEPIVVLTGSSYAEQSEIPWYDIAFCLWAAGFGTTIIYYLFKHRRFIKLVKRWGEDVTNREVMDTLINLKDDMGIYKQIKLQVCPCITSPMLIGFFHLVILFPSDEISSDKLAPILRHELIHLNRNDIWYKALVLFAVALHWFNPVVHLMTKTIALQCEISCDEQVLNGASIQQRKQYSETIINVVSRKAMVQTVLSNNLYGGKNSMKSRIISIMNTTKRKAGVTVLCAVIIAVLGTGTIFAANYSAKPQQEQSQSSASYNGGQEIKQPPYSNVEGKSLQEFLADNGLLKYDEKEHIYRFNGKWVRSVDDVYTFDGVKHGGISKSGIGADDNYYSGEPVDLKVVRNHQSNQIEKLVEVTSTEHVKIRPFEQ